MTKLLKYLGKYKVRAALAPFFKMLEAIFELLVPLVMIKLIDIGIGQENRSYVWFSGLILLLLTIVGYVSSITAQYFAARAAIGFGKSLRNDLFRHINSLSYNEIDKAGTATLITRMTSDVNFVVTGVNMFLRLFLRSPFIVFGAVIMAFTVDASASSAFLVVMPVLIVVVFTITFVSIPLYKKLQGKLDKVTLLTRESMVGVRVIRAFNRQKIEERQFSDATDDLMSSQLLVGRISALMNPVTYLIINLGIASLIYVGALKVDAGELTQGQIVALVNYMSQILVELVKLANLIITLTKAMASARRINDIMDIRSEQEFGETIDKKYAQYSIEFDHVSMSYGDAKEHAIEDISFKAHAGQTIGIIGGTGSGKSTLVNLIPRFYDTSEGSIKINGIDINEYPKEVLREKVGIVPQKSVLFRGTVADNLRISDPKADRRAMDWALDISQSMEFVYSHKEGLNYEILQDGKNLSGGQRQRLCIARALVRRPEILILDDSSSALDYATEAKLRTSLSKASNNRINIIVSQRASSIKHADLIIVMDDGKAVGMGRHEDLYRNCEIYREIYHTQFKESGGVSA